MNHYSCNIVVFEIDFLKYYFCMSAKNQWDCFKACNDIAVALGEVATNVTRRGLAAIGTMIRFRSPDFGLIFFGTITNHGEK